MRKALFLAIALLAAPLLYADDGADSSGEWKRFRFGPKLGVVLFDFQFLDGLPAKTSMDTTLAVGWALRGSVEYWPLRWLGVESGLGYQHMPFRMALKSEPAAASVCVAALCASTKTTTETDIDYKFSALEIPFLVKFRAYINDTQAVFPFATLGASMGLLLGASYSGTSKTTIATYVPYRGTTYESTTTSFSGDMDTASTDFALSVGGGIDTRLGLILDARYLFGLKDIESTSASRIKTKTVLISLGYLF